MIEKILDRLDKVRKRGPQGYMARCPSHADSNPSLSLTQLSDGRILIKCFSGCGALEVLESIGLEMRDLFPEGSLGEYRSFAHIEIDAETRKKERQESKIAADREVLDIAKNWREQGKRLNAADMQRELEAFKRVKNANS